MDLVFIAKPRDDNNEELDRSFLIVSTTIHEEKPRDKYSKQERCLLSTVAASMMQAYKGTFSMLEESR
jgi:hypothetical protein